MQFTDELSRHGARIETILDEILGQSPIAGEIARPARLLAAMRHGALGGGKRLRPFLLAETGRMLGADAQATLRAGAAIELVHCYSLVHDDLPAMDDDDMRRGRPTVHRAFDEATAILAGDALLTLAFAVLADPATHPSGDIRAALVLGLATASGLGGMAGGQMLDLAAEGRFSDQPAGDRDEAAIRRLQAMKTGALLAMAVDMGAIIGGADAAARAALAEYGRAVGAAFQIADDILDVEAQAGVMGKATAKDGEKGKGTLVALLGLAEAKRQRDGLAEKAVAALGNFGAKADSLREAARFTASRRN